MSLRNRDPRLCGSTVSLRRWGMDLRARQLGWGTL